MDGWAARNVIQESKNWSRETLKRQFSHVPCHEDIEPPSAGIVDSSDERKLHELRIHLTEFLTRFLKCYNVTNRPISHPDPFTVFFIKPRRLSPGFPYSGMNGFVYFLDDGQRLWLKERGGNDQFKDSTDEVLSLLLDGVDVPFGKGLCGAVFLKATPLVDMSTKDLIRSYREERPNLARAEDIILQDRMLIEISVYSSPFLSDIVDGPKFVLCIRIPREPSSPQKLRSEPTIKEDGPLSSQEWSTMLEPPVGTMLSSGELQIITEISQQLIIEYAGIVYGSSSIQHEGIVAESKAMREVLDLVRTVAPQKNTTVLLLGETGVGKGVIAREVHRLSPRRSKQFIPVDCGKFPDTLIESELFGHEAGAFTGTRERRIGRFEEANGGTIFLGEIENLSPQAQAKFLRVLDTSQFERLGTTKTITVDVRVIAASNEDVNPARNNGKFRGDLYFRLIDFPINIAPLRERRDDIFPLIQHFMAKARRDREKNVINVSKEVLNLLETFSYPGNVRQLEKVINYGVIRTRSATIGLDDLHPDIVQFQSELNAGKS